MFNDTSPYLDDVFIIDDHEFEKHIPDTYPVELQLNKANTSDKEKSILDLNMKVIGSDIYTSVYDKLDYFWFPIVIFPWLSGALPRLHRTVFTFRSFFILLGVALAFWISIKNFPNQFKTADTGLYISWARKTFGKFFISYFELLSEIGDISFQEYVSNWISSLTLYGDLLHKLRRVDGTANFTGFENS